MSESKEIPEAAVEAAEVAVKEAMHEYGPDGHDDGFQEITRAALKAAAPHMMAQAWEEGASSALDALNSQIKREPYAKLVNPYRTTK